MAAHRRAFTMVEIMMALGIVFLLVTISLVQYDSMSAEAQELAARGELDVLRGEIVRSQLERRMDYTLAVPPRDKEGRDRTDPWGHVYRVDPGRRVVYSVGRNGQDERGEGDDVALKYDPYQSVELRPPTGFKVAEHGSDWARLTWNAVQYSGGVEGYNVFRRDSAGASEFTTTPQNPALLPPEEAPSYRDEGLAVGQVYYYALEVVARDGQKVRAPQVLGFQIPLEGPPRVSISPAGGTVDPGRNVVFTIFASGAGSPLTRLTFDGESWDVNAVEKTVTVNRRWTVPGTYKLVAEATDARARKTLMESQVEVRPPPSPGP